jgi:hypothetical protein
MEATFTVRYDSETRAVVTLTVPGHIQFVSLAHKVFEETFGCWWGIRTSQHETLYSRVRHQTVVGANLEELKANVNRLVADTIKTLKLIKKIQEVKAITNQSETVQEGEISYTIEVGYSVNKDGICRATIILTLPKEEGSNELHPLLCNKKFQLFRTPLTEEWGIGITNERLCYYSIEDEDLKTLQTYVHYELCCPNGVKETIKTVIAENKKVDNIAAVLEKCEKVQLPETETLIVEL